MPIQRLQWVRIASGARLRQGDIVRAVGGSTLEGVTSKARLVISSQANKRRVGTSALNYLAHNELMQKLEDL